MSYSVPTAGNPTSPSKKAWNYAAVGTLIAGPIGTVVGGFIGHRSGKKQQQEEIESGFKTVDSPTFWNSGLSKGFIVGNIVGAGIILAGSVAAAAIGAPLLLPVAFAVGIGTSILKTITGGLDRKNEMQQEYEAAKDYTMRRSEAPVQTAPEKTKERATSPSLPSPGQTPTLAMAGPDERSR